MADKINDRSDKSSGYPKGEGIYNKLRSTDGGDLTINPQMHSQCITGVNQNGTGKSVPYTDYHGTNGYEDSSSRRQANSNEYLVENIEQHFTRDVTDTANDKRPVIYNDTPVFSGATTNVNPTNSEYKDEIIKYGLFSTEIARNKTQTVFSTGDTDIMPPLSPLAPFATGGSTIYTPRDLQKYNLRTINRTKIPIADLEFRKGFQHMFFTRPECYVMCKSNGSIKLSEQAEYDEDFASCYGRMPYIPNILSPVYITGGSGYRDNLEDNWNYLLTNRMLTASTSSEATLSMDENITKSIEGYTVTPGMHYEARQGSSISITFRDTKYLEVYEFIRMWMLYIYKRRRGIFAPSYNGYQYTNKFPDVGSNGSKITGKNITRLYHPYERALDYCASIFDIYTNESMTNIIHSCKYYGVYPTSVSLNGLSSEKGEAISSEITVEVQFKYQYKLENVNKTFIEFNYNSGLTDHLGRSQFSPDQSMPFLLSDDIVNDIPYMGPAGMFTGPPYIVMANSVQDPLESGKQTVTPMLKFMPISKTYKTMDNMVNSYMYNCQSENNNLVETP
jgi:hypothetical protein